MTLLIAGAMIALTVWALVARSVANSQRRITDAVNKFVLERLLTATDPKVAQGEHPTLLQLLDRASAEVGDAFKDDDVRPALVTSVRGEDGLRLYAVDFKNGLHDD